MILTWKMEKTAAGNGRKNSTGIREAGRTPGKAAGRLVTTHQKLLNRTIRCRITGIRIILIQETEHRIIHNNGTIYSRAAMTGIMVINGTATLRDITIPRTIILRTIISRIIILHGMINLKRITRYRLHLRQIVDPLLKHRKKPHQHQHRCQRPGPRKIQSQQKRPNQLKHQPLSHPKRKIKRNRIK